MTPNEPPSNDPAREPSGLPDEHDTPEQGTEPPFISSRLEVEALWAMCHARSSPPPRKDNEADATDDEQDLRLRAPQE